MLKLSDAIRLGAMYGPQLFGTELSNDGGSCALGSAILAIGAIGIPCTDQDPDKNARPGNVATVTVTVPWDMSVKHHCPTCFWKIERPLRHLIPHLNDRHRWTREQIADWVATIEAQQESATQETAEVAGVCA